MTTEFWSDCRAALRSLLRSPGFSIAAIATMASGLAVCVTVFSVINGLVLRDVPVADPERLVAVSSVGEIDILLQEPVSFPDYAELVREARSFDGLVAHRRTAGTIGTGADGRVTLGETVTPNYWRVLGVHPYLGRGFSEQDDSGGVVVLSYTLWRQEYGGDMTIVGRPLDISGRRRTIIGIAPEGFTGVFRGIAPDFWIPVDPAALERTELRSDVAWWVHGRLRAGADQATAARDVEQVGRSIAAAYPQDAGGRRLRAVAFADSAVHPAVPSGALAAGSAGALALAGLLLIVACSNVTQLTLARAQGRSQEFALRSSLGASRWGIVRLLLLEGLALSLLAGFVALLIVMWANNVLSSIKLPIPVRVDLGMRLDPMVVLFLAGTTLVSASLFTIAPALRASRVDLMTVLNRSGVRAGTPSLRRSSALIVQAGFCTVLLILGGLAARSLQHASNIDPGFQIDGMYVATAAPTLAGYQPARAHTYFQGATEALQRVPGVQNVSWVHPVPLSLNMRITRLRLPQGVGLPVQQLPLVDAAIVWPGYFRTMGIQLQAGREFNDTDSPGAVRAAIVNETFVRRYSPDKSPIGQSLEVGFPVPSTVTIVGVVSDIRSRTLGDIARPMVYTAGVQDPLGWQTATAVVRLSAAGANTPQQLTEAMRSIDPTVPVYDVQPLSSRIAAVLILPRYAAAAFGSVGLIALILVSVGLSGVVAYWAAQRAREIGIRVAMGGQPAQIVWLVLRQSLLPAIAGVVVGSTLAVVAARTMTAFLYGISAADPATYLASGLTVAVAATLAALPSAVRALRLDPAATLRQQ